MEFKRQNICGSRLKMDISPKLQDIYPVAKYCSKDFWIGSIQPKQKQNVQVAKGLFSICASFRNSTSGFCGQWSNVTHN